MLMQTSLLLWLHPKRPPTGTMLTGKAMDQKMRGRFGNRELDISEHQRVP